MSTRLFRLRQGCFIVSTKAFGTVEMLREFAFFPFFGGGGGEGRRILALTGLMVISKLTFIHSQTV